MQIFTDRNGNTAGPFTPEQIVQQLHAAELAPCDQLWVEGADQSVSVAQLLGKTPADKATVDHVRSLHRRRPVARRRDGLDDVLDAASTTDIKDVALAASFIPGCGGMLAGGILLVGSISISTVVGFLIIGFFLWGKCEMNRAGAQQQAIQQLRDRIVNHVQRHPEAGEWSWDQLTAAGVVGSDDEGLLEALNGTYHPIAAGSPPEAVVLVTAGSHATRTYYKGIDSTVAVTWHSPDGRWQLSSEPIVVPQRKTRLIVDGPRQLAFESPAISVYPLWNADSSAVAVVETLREEPDRFLLLTLGSAPRQIALPDEIDPDTLLPDEDLAREGQPGSRWTKPEQWLSRDKLEVVVYTSRVFTGPDQRPASSVAARWHFVVSIDREAGLAKVDSRERKYYEHAPIR